MVPAPRPVRADELFLQVAERLTQRFAVGQDGGTALRARPPGPAGCPEWPTACVRSLLVGLQDGFELLAGLRRRSMPGRRCCALPSSRPRVTSWKVFRSLPSRNTASGLTPSTVEELVGRLADALRQHHELAGGRDLEACVAFCCILSEATVSVISSSVGRLAVDVAQRGTHLRQDLALGQHGLGAGVGAGRPSGVILSSSSSYWLPTRSRLQRVVAVGQALHAAREVVGAVRHFGERRGVAHEGLRDRLGQTLRLHQRLAGGRHLLRQAFGAKNGGAGNQQQQQHHDGQQDGQDPLLPRRVGARAAAGGAGRRFGNRGASARWRRRSPPPGSVERRRSWSSVVTAPFLARRTVFSSGTWTVSTSSSDIVEPEPSTRALSFPLFTGSNFLNLSAIELTVGPSGGFRYGVREHSRANTQKLGLLRKRLQVDFLPALPRCIGKQMPDARQVLLRRGARTP